MTRMNEEAIKEFNRRLYRAGWELFVKDIRFEGVQEVTFVTEIGNDYKDTIEEKIRRLIPVINPVQDSVDIVELKHKAEVYDAVEKVVGSVLNMIRED